jgi:riboflavin kinase/FMN adenylyltransferase
MKPDRMPAVWSLKGYSRSMNVYYSHESIDSSPRRGVALGFFDGVHRGHQDLVRTLVYYCEQRGLVPAVFTFPEHPLVTISPETPFAGYLSSLDQRLQRLADTGAEEVFLTEFSPAFAALPPMVFLDQYLKGHLNAGLIVVGQDYRFGRDGQGNLDLLNEWASRERVEVITVPDVYLYNAKISSSRIRRLISEGQAEIAASCLGRPFQMTGTVVQGRKLGRKLGFPTANIEISPDLTVPAYGVYATRTIIDDRTYESITNIGVRPTIQDANPRPNIESFILDRELDLYGRTITVEFLHRLRPEATFNSLIDLVAQVQVDLENTRAYHRSVEKGYCLALVGDIPVRVLKTTRFAQASAIVTFRSRINREDASLFSLLTRVLSASSRRFPSRSGLSAALDSLYGANIETDIGRDGDLLQIHFAVNALMHWTDQSSPFASALDVLFELLSEPDLDADGYFRADIFEAERQGLQMELLARENDKAKYAMDQMMNRLCGDQPYGLRAAGDLETLATLSREALTLGYARLRQSLDCQVTLGGDLKEDVLAQVLDRIALFRPADVSSPSTAKDSSPTVFLPSERLRPHAFVAAAPVSEVQNRQVEQARICLAYTGLAPYFSHHSITDTILNSMLGGDVHSLLFDVVREQLGLAYSVYSVNSRYLSTLLVIAGVMPERVEEARAAMVEQVRLLAAGQFSDRLLERAKTLVDSHIRSIPDDLDQMLAHLMNSINLGRSLSVRDSLSLLEQVTREQVIARAASLNLNTSFILTAKEDPS